MQGWLWNQMFQYAFWKSLAHAHNTELALDIRAYGSYESRNYCLWVFHLNERFSTLSEVPCYTLFPRNKFTERLVLLGERIGALLNKNHIREKSLAFDSSIFSRKGNLYLEWYWPSEKYFLNIREEIISDFTVKISPSEENERLLNMITSSLSVSLHVRRGDYVTNANATKFHWICGLDYYYSAIELIRSKIASPNFFIFSDDIQWVKDNLRIEWDVTFVDCNDSDKNYEDLRLMYSCSHHIIANSTFSWWWAWLWRNPNKLVIAPKQWILDPNINTKDVIPDNWIKL